MAIAEIIAIGSELLLGETQDTNTVFCPQGIKKSRCECLSNANDWRQSSKNRFSYSRSIHPR